MCAHCTQVAFPIMCVCVHFVCGVILILIDTTIWKTSLFFSNLLLSYPFLTYISTGNQANECPLTGVLMCVTALAGVGRVLHGGQQVGNFGPLRRRDVLSHVDDAVHCYFWIRLHKTVKSQIQFIISHTTQLELAIHLELTLGYCTHLIMSQVEFVCVCIVL